MTPPCFFSSCSEIRLFRLGDQVLGSATPCSSCNNQVARQYIWWRYFLSTVSWSFVYGNPNGNPRSNLSLAWPALIAGHDSQVLLCSSIFTSHGRRLRLMQDAAFVGHESSLWSGSALNNSEGNVIPHVMTGPTWWPLFRQLQLQLQTSPAQPTLLSTFQFLDGVSCVMFACDRYAICLSKPSGQLNDVPCALQLEF